MRSTTTVDLHGWTATGMVVPPEVLESLGAGRKPDVTVTATVSALLEEAGRAG